MIYHNTPYCDHLPLQRREKTAEYKFSLTQKNLFWFSLDNAGALGRTPAKVTKVIDVSALNQGPQAAPPSADRSEKLFLALAEAAKQITKLKPPEMIMTSDMVLLNSPKTPSRLRRSETGEVRGGAAPFSTSASFKLPFGNSSATSHSGALASSTNELYRTPVKLHPSASGGIVTSSSTGGGSTNSLAQQSGSNSSIEASTSAMTHNSSSPRTGSLHHTIRNTAPNTVSSSQTVSRTNDYATSTHHGHGYGHHAYHPYNHLATHTSASQYAGHQLHHTSHHHLHSSQSRRESAADLDSEGNPISGVIAGGADDEGWKVECAKLEQDYEEATQRGESVAQANISWKLGMLCRNNGAAIKALTHLAATKEALDKLDPFLYDDLDFSPPSLHYQMGLSSRLVQDIVQAQVFYKDAIKLALQMEDRYLLMLSYQEMGYCLFKLEQWLHALDYFNSYLSELIARYLHGGIKENSSNSAISINGSSSNSSIISTPPISRSGSTNTGAALTSAGGSAKLTKMSSSTNTILKPSPFDSPSRVSPSAMIAPGTPRNASDSVVSVGSKNSNDSLEGPGATPPMSHEDYETLAHTCYNIAYACHKVSQVALAEKFCRRSLNFSKDVFPPLHLKTSLLITSINSFPSLTGGSSNIASRSEKRSHTVNATSGPSVAPPSRSTASSSNATNTSGTLASKSGTSAGSAHSGSAPEHSPNSSSAGPLRLALKTHQEVDLAWDSDSDLDASGGAATLSTASASTGTKQGSKTNFGVSKLSGKSSAKSTGSSAQSLRPKPLPSSITKAICAKSTKSDDDDDDDDWGDIALSSSGGNNNQSKSATDDMDSSDDDWAKDFDEDDSKPSGAGGSGAASLTATMNAEMAADRAGNACTGNASSGNSKPLLKMQLLLSDNMESSVDEVAPFKLLPERGDVNIVKVIYPKPSILYSIKTVTGHNQLSETELDNWLLNLVSKYRDEVVTHKEAKLRLKEQEAAANAAAAAASTSQTTSSGKGSSSSSKSSDRKRAGKGSGSSKDKEKENPNDPQPTPTVHKPPPPYHDMPFMSRDWCTELLSYAHQLISQDQIEECWGVVTFFFSHAKHYLATHKSLKGSRLTVASNLAFIASRLWTPSMDSEFNFILSVVGKLAPLYTLTSNIMLVETLAHHSLPNRSMWKQLTTAYEDAEAEIQKLDAQEVALKGANADLPVHHQSNDEDDDFDDELDPSKTSGTRKESKAFSKSKSGSSSASTATNVDSVTSSASSTANSTINVASSSSSGTHQMTKKEKATERSLKTIQRNRSHCKTMQARILADVGLFFLDRSMLSTRVQQIKAEEEEADDGAGDTYLCEDEERIRRLMVLYPQLENGWDKAKCALALGLSYTIAQDYDLAERLLFECVYMLDTMPATVPGMRPIVSELGASALTAFGQVLADNYKYKYSVPAIDGALLLCDMRGREEDYYALLRTAAKLAQTAGDLPRAIDLYSEIVEHYRVSHRINEAVYVNELLCTMHIENGSFQQAINCLQRASESLPDYSRFFDETAPKNSSFDPGFLRLQLQTAKTLLTSYHWDKAYDLLEQMTRYRQPVPLMLATYELLARAFLKKRSFSEADSWIDTWREFQKSQSTLDGRLLSRRYSVSNNNANMTYDVAYYAMKAKNCFFANKLTDALEFVDKAILFSSASRLASLGKFYYLRGRILRRMCRVSFSMQFPTTLKPKNSFSSQPSGGSSNASGTSSGSSMSSGSSSSGSTNNQGGGNNSNSVAIASVQMPGGSSSAASGSMGGDRSYTIPLSPRGGPGNPMDAVDTPVHIFDRPSDLLQECVATYRQSYNYFKLTGDDCKVAKALSDMAEAYLEFLFWPVASSESTFDDISTFPFFKLSMIATNAREEQRQNVINLDRKREQQKNAEKLAQQQQQMMQQGGEKNTVHHAGPHPLIHTDSNESTGSSASITSTGLSRHRGPAASVGSASINSSSNINTSTAFGPDKREGSGSALKWQSHSSSSVPPSSNNPQSSGSGNNLSNSTSSSHTPISPLGGSTSISNPNNNNSSPRTPNSSSHKRSQSAMASIVPIDHSSPRDKSPESQANAGGTKTSISSNISVTGASTGSPSSGKMKHRSDRMKKKHSHSKVSMLMKEGSVSSTTSGVSSGGSSGTANNGKKSDLKDSGSRSKKVMYEASTTTPGDESAEEIESSGGSGYHSTGGGHSHHSSNQGVSNSNPNGNPNNPPQGAAAQMQPQNFTISLKTIENAAKLSLEIASYTGNVMLALNGYMNLAETRFLEGKMEAATSFFIECTEQLSNYFLNGTKFILNEAPPSFLARAFALVKRVVRFLFCLPKSHINRNLHLVDLYLGLENDLEQQLKKAVGSQVFGTYVGSDASLPRSLFSLKLQKKYRSERTTSFSQLVTPGSISSGSTTLTSSTSIQDGKSSSSVAGANSSLNSGNSSNASTMSSNASMSHQSSQRDLLNQVSAKDSGGGTMGGTKNAKNATTNGANSTSSTNPSSSLFNNPQEEHTIAKNNASLIWGYYFYLRQQQKRYGEGKLTREELKSRYTKSLRLMLRLATIARSQEADYIREWNKRMTTVLTRKASRMILQTPLKKSVPSPAALIAAAAGNSSDTSHQHGSNYGYGSFRMGGGMSGTTPTSVTSVFSAMQHGSDENKFGTIRGTSNQAGEPPGSSRSMGPNAERERSDSTGMMMASSNNLASPVKNPSFEEIVSNRNEKLSKLVYILQLDDRLVQYVPSTGRRCVQLIGKREQLANSTSPRHVPPHVFMRIHLLDVKEESVTIVVPSDLSLNDVIYYLLQRMRWDEDVHPAASELIQRELEGQGPSSSSSHSSSTMKHAKNFFTSFLTSLPLISSSSTSSSSTSHYFPNDRVEKVAQSAHFYDEFAHLLSLIGDDDSSTPNVAETPSSNSNPSLNNIGVAQTTPMDDASVSSSDSAFLQQSSDSGMTTPHSIGGFNDQAAPNSSKGHTKTRSGSIGGPLQTSSTSKSSPVVVRNMRSGSVSDPSRSHLSQVNISSSSATTTTAKSLKPINEDSFSESESDRSAVVSGKHGSKTPGSGKIRPSTPSKLPSNSKINAPAAASGSSSAPSSGKLKIAGPKTTSATPPSLKLHGNTASGSGADISSHKNAGGADSPALTESGGNFVQNSPKSQSVLPSMSASSLPPTLPHNQSGLDSSSGSTTILSMPPNQSASTGAIVTSTHSVHSQQSSSANPATNSVPNTPRNVSATPRSQQQPPLLVLPSSPRRQQVSIPSSLITLAKRKEQHQIAGVRSSNSSHAHSSHQGTGGGTTSSTSSHPAPTRSSSAQLTGNLIPLRSKLHKRVYESFTNHELARNSIGHPLEVFLYMNTAKVARAGSAFNASFANSIHFSDELSAYLHSLSGKTSKDAVGGGASSSSSTSVPNASPSPAATSASMATSSSSTANSSSNASLAPNNSATSLSSMGSSDSFVSMASNSSSNALSSNANTFTHGANNTSSSNASNSAQSVASVDPSTLIDKKSGKSLAPILFELNQLFAPLIEILPLGNTSRPLGSSSGGNATAGGQNENANISPRSVGQSSASVNVSQQRCLLTMDAKVYWKSFMGDYGSSEERSAKIANRAPEAMPNDQGSGGIVTRTPLSIICSKYMHAIPWELFLPTDTVLRYFALEDAAGRPTRLAMKHSTARKLRKKVNFSLLQCFYSQSFRNIQQQENIRKNWILQNVNNSLNLATERYAADYNGDNSPIFPFHTPLISHPKRITHYRSKYKHIQFIDLWTFVMNPDGIVNTTNSLETPVLLLSYCDLLEMSSTLLTLSRSKKTPTFLFIPETHFKEVSAKLGKRHTIALKSDSANTEDAYQFLMNLVLAVSKDLSVPIAVFHPPAL